jgi:ADP-heptose:LPS heptosyltransferase
MIIIAPCSRALRNGKRNPRDYPCWKELCELLIKEGFELVQVGVDSEERFVEDFRTLDYAGLCSLIDSCETYITIDSFFQHLGWSRGKKGIVLFSVSNPLIFGHHENINLVDFSNLRKDQFNTYENTEFNADLFPKPEVVLDNLKLLRKA